jgi:peptidoglycan/LPS O-acetylase OafA/YrhL
MSPEERHSWTRLDGVDLLRGLAILCVLMNHVNTRLRVNDIPYTEGFPEPLVHALTGNGQFGVQIFFAISGFLITSITLKRWGALQNVNVRDFYLLRLARIGSLLLALLAILSVLHFAGLQDFVVSARKGGLGRALLAALTFHVNVLEAHRGYLPANWDVLWSLSVEEMFYLFFPLAAWLLGRVKLFIPFLCVFIVLGPFARAVFSRGNDIWQDYSYLGGMDAIALGCLTALLVAHARFSPPTLRAWACACRRDAWILGFSVPVPTGSDRTGRNYPRDRNVPGDHRGGGHPVAVPGFPPSASASRSTQL